MAFLRTRHHRFLDLAKASSYSSHIRFSVAGPDRAPSLLRRILQRRLKVPPSLPPDGLSLPVGNKLIEMTRGLNADRIRLDLVSQLPSPPPLPQSLPSHACRMTLAEVEAVRSRLSAILRSSISYSDFLRICRVESSTEETAAAIAHSLEESGSVIAYGNFVFLRPDDIARSIGRVVQLPAPNHEQRMKELREMEEKKAKIEKKAAACVRRELWCGLGFLLAQTLGFIRLTFWELSWDVMEPVCFYVTSVYFLAGYAFFLKTSRDPSFEGFFQSRFAAKQKRFLRDWNFDLIRFNELKQQASFLPGNAHSHELVSPASSSCRRSS